MRLLISAWIAGQVLFLFLSKPHIEWGWFILPALLTLIYSVFQGYKTNQLRFFLIWGFLSILMILGGYTWVRHLDLGRQNNQLNPILDEKVITIQGYIDELPKLTAKGQSLIISVQQADALLPQKIAVFSPKTNQDPAWIPGQYWQLTVQLKTIHGLKNPYGFDLEQWMSIQGIGAQAILRPQGAKFIREPVWFDRYFFEKLRYLLRKKMMDSLGADSPYVGVMIALVIGDQGMIAPSDWAMFSATGIGHLISISGLHITMLAACGASLFNWWWRKGTKVYVMPAQKGAALFRTITAIFYTFLAGFQIPAQRTTLMLGVSGLGLYSGRILHPFDVWFWALWIVLLIQPWAIYFPGFWLSFGAVAAILYGLPKDPFATHDVDLIFLQKLKTSFLEACRVQAIVTIALIPLTLYWFYQISMISPIANTIAIPVISFLVTPLAMLGAFLPWIFGDACLWLSHTIFSLLATGLHRLSDLDWSLMNGAKPTWYAMGIALLGVILAIRPGEFLKTWKSRTLGLVLCGLLWLPKERIATGEWEMVVWDIGQGNSVLIKTAHHTLIFDTGPIGFGKFNPAEKVIIPHLRATGISSIDRLVISHEDADHIGGLEYLLENHPVQFLIGSIPSTHSLQGLFKRQGIAFQSCQAGMKWEWEGVEFRVWHPQKDQEHLRPNERSCVLEVRNQHHSLWLTGDIEKVGEAMVSARLESSPKEYQAILARKVILMVPHHGSKTSSTMHFLDTLDPEEVFSQTGYKNRYRHPHPDVVHRYQGRGLELLDTVYTGAQIWRTDGMVVQRKLLRF
jgi:competence protein ComEC